MNNRYARIEGHNNHVVEFFVNTTGIPMDKLFHPDMLWVLCPYEAVKEGWRHDPTANTFLEPLPDPAPSPEEILETMRKAIQAHLDTKPKERLYDGILSLCTYATSTNIKFAAEGQAGVVWRDACWAKGYEIMAEVQAGTREIPTVERLLSEMPEFSWPAVAE